MSTELKLSVALNDVPVGKALDAAEAAVIEQAMQVSRYNQSRTAINLGISRGSLRTKLKTYFGNKYIA